jgi:hypothetical protein
MPVAMMMVVVVTVTVTAVVVMVVMVTMAAVSATLHRLNHGSIFNGGRDRCAGRGR